MPPQPRRMPRRDVRAKRVGGDPPGGVALAGRARSVIGSPSSESPERGEDQPQGAFGHMMLFVARRSAGRRGRGSNSRIGFSASRLPDRIIQAASAPAPSRSKASNVPSTTSRTSVSPARARSTASAMLPVTRSAIDRASSACSPAAEPKWWSRLAWVRPTLRRDRLQRHRLRALLEQQLRAPPPARRPGFPPSSGVYGLLTYV